jgi:ABC-type Fe3+-hydroxamate transport system substrate-binding protein
MSIKKHTDQLGREVAFTFPPKRIVSLVPSQTELLYYFGLDEEVKGITKFCVHPDVWYRNKARIGGTKKIDHKAIEQIKPDLIIANKEENTREDIERLEQKFPVWISDIKNFDDALEMIELLGEATDREEKAKTLIESLNSAFSKLDLPTHPKRVLYVIWHNPIMVAGKNTFIDEMLRKAGFQNAIIDPYSRYPELTQDDIRALKPELIFLSSEPFPFAEKHIQSFQSEHEHTKVLLVNGEIFSWYGSRMLMAPTYFQELIDRTK